MRRGAYIIAGILATLSMGLHAQGDANGCCKSNKPCVHITVHKQCDKEGNITSYDSVYTYTFDGSLADTGFMNSIMKHGGMSIQIFTNPNGMPDFMSDPFFQQFDIGIDMDKVQKMMERQMQEMIQNAGMPDMQQFMQYPAPPPCCTPKNKDKQHKSAPKKVIPKHNNANGGVQI